MKYLDAFLNGEKILDSQKQEPTKPTKPTEAQPMPGATFDGELWQWHGWIVPTKATIEAMDGAMSRAA
jgi:hypothetical protein